VQQVNKLSTVLARNNVKVLASNGPVMLYAHGFGCNQNMWGRVTPSFLSTHQQVLFDYVGCGQSDARAFDPDKYASLNGYAQDVLDVCDALGLKRDVIFVAHSVSCSIGMLAAIARPELFSKMILIGPNPCFVNHPPDYIGGFEQDDLEGLLALMDQNYIGWANYLAPVVASQDAFGAVTRELSASFCSTDPMAAKAFAQATFFSDNRADLQKVSPACLVLQHRQDTLAPLAVGEYLQAHLQKSTLKVLDVSGHCAHMSDPALVIGAIRNFIQTA
jgi:sigma-B regulation protein RsbQ